MSIVEWLMNKKLTNKEFAQMLLIHTPARGSAKYHPETGEII